MTERTAEIQQIVEQYVNKYTCAQFAERLATIERESQEANDWFLKKRAELNITAQEIEAALENCKQDPRTWDDKVIK